MKFYFVCSMSILLTVKFYLCCVWEEMAAFSVEEALLSVVKQSVHDNLSFASGMNVVFL